MSVTKGSTVCYDVAMAHTERVVETEHLTLRIDVRQAKMLREIASQEDYTVSQLVRRAIREYLERRARK